MRWLRQFKFTKLTAKLEDLYSISVTHMLKSELKRSDPHAHWGT